MGSQPNGGKRSEGESSSSTLAETAVAAFVEAADNTVVDCNTPAAVGCSTPAAVAECVDCGDCADNTDLGAPADQVDGTWQQRWRRSWLSQYKVLSDHLES